MKSVHNPKALISYQSTSYLVPKKTLFFRTFVKLMLIFVKRMLIFYFPVDIFPFFIVFFPSQTVRKQRSDLTTWLNFVECTEIKAFVELTVTENIRTGGQNLLMVIIKITFLSLST